MQSPSAAEIYATATLVIYYLNRNGLSACLFGSAACAIYGMEARDPNDVDVIVLTTTRNAEDIKILLAYNDPRFLLRSSANPQNTYQVLYFCLPRDPFNLEWEVRTCKVDILTPGTISIPNIPRQMIVYRATHPYIPLAPLLVLLLLKLRGWMDRRGDLRSEVREKAVRDAQDVVELLQLVAAGVYEVHLLTESWMPSWFVDEGRNRVRQFVWEWPQTARVWFAMGFEMN